MVRARSGVVQHGCHVNYCGRSACYRDVKFATAEYQPFPSAPSESTCACVSVCGRELRFPW